MRLLFIWFDQQLNKNDLLFPCFTYNALHAIRQRHAHSQNSTCYFEINQENDKEKILQATITIVNATDVEVSTAIHGSNFNVIHSDINSMKKMQMLMSEERTAKTFTVIYRHNGTQTRNRRFNLGQRQIGDKQLHFETKNATIGFRFAETEFKYNDPNKFITAIGFSLEVSGCILYDAYRIYWRLPSIFHSKNRQRIMYANLINITTYFSSLFCRFSRRPPLHLSIVHL